MQQLNRISGVSLQPMISVFNADPPLSQTDNCINPFHIRSQPMHEGSKLDARRRTYELVIPPQTISFGRSREFPVFATVYSSASSLV